MTNPPLFILNSPLDIHSMIMPVANKQCEGRRDTTIPILERGCFEKTALASIIKLFTVIINSVF
jgi:hypothetical protein